MTRPSSTTSLGHLIRFGILGAMNTLLTSVLFYLLLLVIPQATVAFTIAYLAGLAYVVTLTPRLVFGTGVSHRRRALLAAWYLVVYVIGLGAVALIHAEITTDRVLTVLLTLTVTAPLGFLGSRYIVVVP